MIEDDKNKLNKNYTSKPVVEDGVDEDVMNFSWSAVSKQDRVPGIKESKRGLDNFLADRIDFVGKNLEDGKFSKEDLQDANFSVANLKNIDLSGANLRGVDFSGADLTGANLSSANLQGAVFNGAKLVSTNFTGANLKGVKLVDADITDAILLDISIDEIGLEELQELVEYLAKYYPHKLNLTKINLTMLDLSKIDLRNVSLRGVDFTGCNFTGVNIMELDLSECIITPEQIAQALGRVPSKEEMEQILAPKKKEGKSGGKGVDLEGLFNDDGRQFGVSDYTRSQGVAINDIISAGKKVFRHSAEKPPIKDKEVLDKIKEEHKKEAQSDKEELRSKIEENKRNELEKRKEQQKEAASTDRFREEKIKQQQMRVQEEKRRQQEKNKNRSGGMVMHVHDRSRD